MSVSPHRIGEPVGQGRAHHLDFLALFFVALCFHGAGIRPSGHCLCLGDHKHGCAAGEVCPITGKEADMQSDDVCSQVDNLRVMVGDDRPERAVQRKQVLRLVERYVSDQEDRKLRDKTRALQGVCRLLFNYLP